MAGQPSERLGSFKFAERLTQKALGQMVDITGGVFHIRPEYASLTPRGGTQHETVISRSVVKVEKERVTVVRDQKTLHPNLDRENVLYVRRITREGVEDEWVPVTPELSEQHPDLAEAAKLLEQRREKAHASA